eukprot:877275-Pyramimonas_sp.AAC.1
MRAPSQHTLKSNKLTRQAAARLYAPRLLVQMQKHPQQAHGEAQGPCLPHKCMRAHRVKALDHVQEHRAGMVAYEAASFLLQVMRERRGSGSVTAPCAPYLSTVVPLLPLRREPTSHFGPNPYASMAQHEEP